MLKCYVLQNVILYYFILYIINYCNIYYSTIYYSFTYSSTICYSTVYYSTINYSIIYLEELRGNRFWWKIKNGSQMIQTDEKRKTMPTLLSQLRSKKIMKIQ